MTGDFSLIIDPKLWKRLMNDNDILHYLTHLHENGLKQRDRLRLILFNYFAKIGHYESTTNIKAFR